MDDYLEKEDKYRLIRFIEVHQLNFDRALQEINEYGMKMSHWMWYIFPQISGLGTSPTSMFFAISCLDEAREYLNNKTLRENTNKICNALLSLETNDPNLIFGELDAMKLKSSLTLFEKANPENDIFSKLLIKFFNGERDQITLELIEQKNV